MEMSPDIGEITKALIEFRKECVAPKKRSSNPHFKSKFADLETVLDAIQPALDVCGLAVVQFPSSGPGGVGVETLVSHASGQWLRGRYELPLAKSSPQDGGSAITYARRYALLGALGIAAEDDDGETAVGRGKSERAKEQKPARTLDDVAGKQTQERAQPAAKVDEYGIAIPAGECPVVKSGDNIGKRWTEINRPLLEKWVSERGNEMTVHQKSWLMYALARHQARKAREQKEATNV